MILYLLCSADGAEAALQHRYPIPRPRSRQPPNYLSKAQTSSRRLEPFSEIFSAEVTVDEPNEEQRSRTPSSRSFNLAQARYSSRHQYIYQSTDELETDAEKPQTASLTTQWTREPEGSSGEAQNPLLSAKQWRPQNLHGPPR